VRQAGADAVSKKQLSPYGCKDCVHAWIDRCGLTGWKMKYAINAKHHCVEFKRDRRNDPDRVAPDRAGDLRTGTDNGNSAL
jgi:hypothetical protein